ncbi:MAG: hypothetical protein L0220_20730 [Acidobacteria bacterium]|nr:hypothetical protein [Acidobacteriota bacterium]
MNPDPQDLLNHLKSINGYPFDPVKDQPFIIDLLLEFPNVDFPEELKRLKIWLSDTMPYPRLHYRLLLRTWIRNASKKSKAETSP